MGGILSAEVVLLAPYSPTSMDVFRHRILGTVNFDTPFLGMHPGVITSGIGSLFRPPPKSPRLDPQSSEKGRESLAPESPSQSQTLSPTVSKTSTNPVDDASGYFGAENEATSGGTPGSEMTVAQRAARSALNLPTTDDPNYDPPYPNDIRIPVRKGWNSTLHFIFKHSDGLTKATKSYVTSHLEFGGTLADYKALKNRYSKIRPLEDVDDSQPKLNEAHHPRRRVRFVNFYTASTGRIKPASPKPQLGLDGALPPEHDIQELSLAGPSTLASSRSTSRSPRISIEEHRDGAIVPVHSEDFDEIGLDGTQDTVENASNHSASEGGMNHMEPAPVVSDDEREDSQQVISDGDEVALNPDSEANMPQPLKSRSSTTRSLSEQQSSLALPPIQPEPSEPPLFKPDIYTEKDARKLAEKDYARQVKSYKIAVKDRDKAIKDRRKLLEKREKNARLAREKQVRLEERQRIKEEKQEAKEQEKREAEEQAKKDKNAKADPSNPNTSAQHVPAGLSATTTEVPPPDEGDGPIGPAPDKAAAAGSETRTQPPTKKKRDRKFCMLPPRDDDGERDACWARVFMEGVDEVGAHTGLFVTQNPHYEALVGDVGLLIEGWVREADETRRRVVMDG